MVKVICDTDFLIKIATKKIKNFDSIYMEIGNIDFVIPHTVIKELKKLKKIPKKIHDAESALKFSSKFEKLEIHGEFADQKILEYVKKNGGFVGTLDKTLKNKVKQVGGSIISLSNDKIILES